LSKSYFANTELAGAVKVDFTNDASGRDVRVDYLAVNGEVRQAEAQSINTAAYQNGKCVEVGRQNGCNAMATSIFAI
jgi:endo-1,4-beta-xylanase